MPQQPDEAGGAHEVTSANETSRARLGQDVPEYYADSTRLTLSPYTFGIEFGVLAFPPPGEVAANEIVPMVRVRMSPQLAYAMRQLLDSNIAAYEDQIGKIALPTQFAAGPGGPS